MERLTKSGLAELISKRLNIPYEVSFKFLGKLAFKVVRELSRERKVNLFNIATLYRSGTNPEITVPTGYLCSNFTVEEDGISPVLSASIEMEMYDIITELLNKQVKVVLTGLLSIENKGNGKLYCASSTSLRKGGYLQVRVSVDLLYKRLFLEQWEERLVNAG